MSEPTTPSGLSLLWQKLTAPGPVYESESNRSRAVLFHSMVLVVIPLIVGVGLVAMPAVVGSSPWWRSPTVLPATSALVVSGVSLAMSRLGWAKPAIVLYAAMFVVAPGVAVIQGGNLVTLPIGTLMIGGPLIITALFESIALPTAFVLAVVGGSALIPLMQPLITVGEAAALIAANGTNGAMVLTYSFYRTRREQQTRAVIEQGKANLEKQRDLFNSLVGNLPGILFRASLGPDRRLSYLSTNFCAVTGHHREPFVRNERSLFELVEVEYQEHLREVPTHGDPPNGPFL